MVNIWFSVLVSNIIYLSSINTFSSEIWTPQQSNVSSQLFRCQFTDSLTGWVVGDSGKILHTTNGGNTWFQQSSGLNYYIFDLSFINSSTGWCIASDLNTFANPVLLKTTNAGVIWQNFYSPDTNFLLLSVHFLNNNTGWLAGFQGIILHTTDGGINWANETDTTAFGGNNIWRISFFNSNFGFACGGWQDLSGVVWKSNPSGSNWVSQGISPEPVYKVVYKDSLNGFGMGGDPEYGTSTIKTTNGGVNWQYEFIDIFGIAKSFAYRTPDEIWAPLSIGRSWAVSTNAGANWVQIFTPDSSYINDIYFTDPYHGWAVGDAGVILKYNTEFIGIKNISSAVPENILLFQNYPNPFNHSTIIEYQTDKFSKINISLYDVLGRHILDIFNGFIPAGTQRISFNSSAVPSGIYFYKLTSGNFSETKKLVIVK